MPATKVSKIQSARYKRAVNGSLIKPAKQSNTDRCIDYIIDYIDDVKSDKKLNKCYDADTESFLRSTNCSSIDKAKEEFYDDEKAYYACKIESGNSKNINKVFHIINSFKGHSVPASKVHAIGVEFARRLAGDNFKYVVATHTNTDHYHNHIVINAYATDGPYKFKDDWNLGLKLQRISNELSLENGVEIITEKLNDSFELDENKLTFVNIRDCKMANNGNGSAKSHLMSDIILTAKSVSNWNDYKKQMEKKGYEIRENTKSVTYCLPKIGAIRDNRLGRQFTKYHIESYFKEKEELTNISKSKVKINLYNIKTPKFIGNGKNRVRIPIIIRLVSFLIQVFKEILKSAANSYQKNINFQKINIKNLENQLKNLENIKFLLEKHDINNFSALKIRKNQILKEYTVLNNHSKFMTTYVKKLKSIKDTITKYNLYKEDMDRLGIKDEELNLYNYTESDILINRAKLHPMRPKIQSRLYKALHNSGYVLKYQYNQLTDEDAKEICYFLSKKKQDINADIDKPNTLYTKAEYIRFKRQNKLFSQQKTPLQNRFLSINYNELCDKHKILKDNESKKNTTEYIYGYETAIIEYRNAILKLRSYGLNTLDKIKDFEKNTIDVILQNYNYIHGRISELKEELDDYNKIDSFYNGSYENIYKPIKMLSEHEVIEKNIKSYLAESKSKTEELICLKNNLDNIDLSILDDEEVIIAPADILAITKIVSNLIGNNVSTDDVLRYDKSKIKGLLTAFKEDIDIENELEHLIKNEQFEEVVKEKKEKEIENAKIKSNNTKQDSQNDNDFEADNNYIRDD